MLEVDKKYLHQVRREVEVNAIRIFCTKINNPNATPSMVEAIIDNSVEYAIAIRKEVDEKIKEKAVAPTTSGGTGDIDKL